MDHPPHDYPASAAMAYAQAHQQQLHQTNIPQQQFGFHPQHQQFPPSVRGPPFLPLHRSLQPYPFLHQQRPQQLHSHAPQHPHLLQLQQQQPPTTFPPHISPHLVPSHFTGPYDSVPPPVPPPDTELQKQIDTLAHYAAKNGPEFEAMIREKHQDSRDYNFLFGGEGHGYYFYKLWLCTRSPGPFNTPFPSSMPIMHPPPNPMMTPAGPHNPGTTGASGPRLDPPQMHRPPFLPYFDQKQPHSQPYQGHDRLDYEQAKTFRGLSCPLPSDVAMELTNVLSNLSGTKDSIKGAKMWFMQRSPFAPALAEALRDRVFAVDDAEKQLHIIYLANDILFDRIFHNPQNKEENQSRLQKILQFWASKEVYDQETIHVLENEMLGALSANPFHGPPKEPSGSAADNGVSGLSPQAANSDLLHWQQDRQSSFVKQEQPDRPGPPVSAVTLGQQFLPSAVPPVGFTRSIPLTTSGILANQPLAPSTNLGEKLPPCPLFPPGLIPRMVKKQQIGSGVPYSPMSPLDIPTVIPPSDIPESEAVERVTKFFKEIGKVNPSEGPMDSSDSRYEDDYEREPPDRKGGACIPPPANLQADPETGTYPDGSFDHNLASSGSGPLGLGASTNPNEVSQYDDVYTSYRKERRTSYHWTMSARAGTR